MFPEILRRKKIFLNVYALFFMHISMKGNNQKNVYSFCQVLTEISQKWFLDIFYAPILSDLARMIQMYWNCAQ